MVELNRESNRALKPGIDNPCSSVGNALAFRPTRSDLCRVYGLVCIFLAYLAFWVDFCLKEKRLQYFTYPGLTFNLPSTLEWSYEVLFGPMGALLESMKVRLTIWGFFWSS